MTGEPTRPNWSLSGFMTELKPRTVAGFKVYRYLKDVFPDPIHRYQFYDGEVWRTGGLGYVMFHVRKQRAARKARDFSGVDRHHGA